MAGLSDAFELKVLDHLFGGPSLTAPGTVYLALVTVAVTDADTGSTITEATYTGYARKSVATSDWRAAASGQKKNLNTITFAACTGSTSTVIGVAVCTASSAGDVIGFGTVTSTVVSSGITPEFATDAIVISLD